MSQSLFNQPLNVINVGIAMFSDDLKKSSTPPSPSSTGRRRAGAICRWSRHWIASPTRRWRIKIAAANQQALERIIQSHPVLIGF